MLYKEKIKQVLFIGCCFAASSCGVYSFSGASISPDIKNVTVNYFGNEASIVVPTLSQSFTETLKDKIISSTSLILSREPGDVRFEGEIIDYSTRPIAIQGNETSSQTRLTISVRVRYINTKDEKQNFENVFTRYTDFPSEQNLSSVENELIRKINDELAEDIFNKAFVNW